MTKLYLLNYVKKIKISKQCFYNTLATIKLFFALLTINLYHPYTTKSLPSGFIIILVRSPRCSSNKMDIHFTNSLVQEYSFVLFLLILFYLLSSLACPLHHDVQLFVIMFCLTVFSLLATYFLFELYLFLFAHVLKQIKLARKVSSLLVVDIWTRLIITCDFRFQGGSKMLRKSPKPPMVTMKM